MTAIRKTLLIVLILSLCFSCKKQPKSEIQNLNPTPNSSQKDGKNHKTNLLTNYPFKAIHSNIKPSYQDSLELLQLWRKDAFTVLDTVNTALSNLELQQLLLASTDGIKGISVGRVYASPDHKFKIFGGRGASCGAYCNPYWISKIVRAKGSPLYNLHFKDVETIALMPDGKYLVLESSFGRPASVYSETTKSATLIAFEGSDINYQRFNYKYPKYGDIQSDSLYNPTGKLVLSQEHFITNKPDLTYHPKSQRLTYQYATDFSYCCQIDSVYAYKGAFEYKNGTFIHVKEQKQYIKVD
ncbi:hypothetical protein [Winogradskyella arenosi]|uniref:DKNYY family protein n=1 Tax=Winogradskyella arenosi TaxID=533325 RepID=A0A368ZI90_9FLAO|nr:hypothetical protein [Winogradskyella arenosi]RCW93499.1 hypothetical protein DFQ08_101294 [Winogradskyella arenosi]